MVHVFERQIGGRMLRIEQGKLAEQANAAVTIQYGDTVLLVAVTSAPQPREGIDFLPFTVDYEERLYAAGKIPGSFFRREGRPTTEATLAMRQVDRPLRPMFPKNLRNEVQVVITALSADQENIPDILGIIGASAALSISDIPFDGPVGGCRIGYINDELVVNPTFQQLEDSTLDLVVAGTRDAVVMVESGAKEVSEALLLQALKLGQIVNGELADLQDEMVRQVGKAKFRLPSEDHSNPPLENAIVTAINGRLESVLLDASNKGDREAGLARLKADIVGRLSSQGKLGEVAEIFDAYLKKVVRETIVHRGIRPDGRTTKEIRPITCEVGLLPRTHGSGLFTRGQTQVLSITTLGSMSQQQRLDTIGVADTRRYMHHYNFPGYSTGEVRRVGNPGRREIGHGALAERALEPVIPSEEEFPYTIRVVSEVLSSNGSTSMGSVCGSTLSLMDAGVPIKKPVAGAAMGLVKLESGEFAVLTDIQGMEDALGDMDFKVAGTADGVTALQMDIKVKGITFEVMQQALEQDKDARLFILSKMTSTIAQARPQLSKYAPRITRIMISPEKIGAVIGPGGKTIRAIADETKATIDIEDDGTVLVSSVSEEGARRAIQIIEGLTKEVEVGTIYTGRVTRIMTFGAFVEIMPSKEGLVHISELAA
ncbi:MAG: polyribonucleotide nucleotidyltransferase, partial [Dehalococcoidia bacterium]|nr:polyribonucleotide nucleotidyltransferase [Dehalococcoidia bacterium]